MAFFQSSTIASKPANLLPIILQKPPPNRRRDRRLERLADRAAGAPEAEIPRRRRNRRLAFDPTPPDRSEQGGDSIIKRVLVDAPPEQPELPALVEDHPATDGREKSRINRFGDAATGAAESRRTSNGGRRLIASEQRLTGEDFADRGDDLFARNVVDVARRDDARIPVIVCGLISVSVESRFVVRVAVCVVACIAIRSAGGFTVGVRRIR